MYLPADRKNTLWFRFERRHISSCARASSLMENPTAILDVIQEYWGIYKVGLICLWKWGFFRIGPNCAIRPTLQFCLNVPPCSGWNHTGRFTYSFRVVLNVDTCLFAGCIRCHEYQTKYDISIILESRANGKYYVRRYFQYEITNLYDDTGGMKKAHLKLCSIVPITNWSLFVLRFS